MAKFFLAWNIPASGGVVEMPLAPLSSYCNMLVCLFCLLGFFFSFFEWFSVVVFLELILRC